MRKLHGHVLLAVDGLRPYVAHEELDQLYRTPRHTGDLRRIAELLDVLADVATPRLGGPACEANAERDMASPPWSLGKDPVVPNLPRDTEADSETSYSLTLQVPDPRRPLE